VSNESDRLLYVVSAKKEMSWVSFKETFDYLYQLQAAALSVYIDRIKDKRFQAVRALDSLGHCDFDFRENGSRVYAAPPALVRLPCAGLPQAILAGVRSPQTIKELSKACQSIGSHVKLEITQQPGELVLMPVRVAVQAGDVAELAIRSVCWNYFPGDALSLVASSFCCFFGRLQKYSPLVYYPRINLESSNL
jgi:hypothetical protein